MNDSIGTANSQKKKEHNLRRVGSGRVGLQTTKNLGQLRNFLPFAQTFWPNLELGQEISVSAPVSVPTWLLRLLSYRLTQSFLFLWSKLMLMLAGMNTNRLSLLNFPSPITLHLLPLSSFLRLKSNLFYLSSLLPNFGPSHPPSPLSNPYAIFDSVIPLICPIFRH